MRLLQSASEPAAGAAWQVLGCQRDPFAETADPAAFFATPAAQKLYMSLLTVLRIGDGGLLLVTGEAGVGKTLLLHVLRNTLQAGGEQVRLWDGADTAWLDQLDGPGGAPPSRDILLIDGAEAWDGRAITRLEQLYEQRGEQARALRLVIAGRPEIEQRLQKLIATAAGTKITFARLRLDALEPSCVAELIRHRLRVAGAVFEGPFTPAAVHSIAGHANGNPRQAMEACRTALLPQPQPEAPPAAAESAAELPVAPAAAPAAVPPRPRRAMPLRSWVTAATLALLAAAAGTAATYLTWPQPGQQMTALPATPPAETPPRAASAPAPAVTAESPPPTPPPALPAPPPEIASPTYTAALAAISPAAGPPEPKRSGFDAAFAFARRAPVAPPPVTPATGLPVPPDVLTLVAAEPAPALLAVKPPPAPEPAAAPAPAPAPAAASERLQLAQAEIAALTERGDAYLRLGDIVSARPFYERAARAGDANAALLLGQTYDPGLLAKIGLRGLRGDAAKAAEWYRVASSLGAGEAQRLLGDLPARP